MVHHRLPLVQGDVVDIGGVELHFHATSDDLADTLRIVAEREGNGKAAGTLRDTGRAFAGLDGVWFLVRSIEPPPCPFADCTPYSSAV